LFKNVTMAGRLLQISAFGAGAISTDNRGRIDDLNSGSAVTA
jgi:uncharacterized membrane protein YphA (DoxX/SURF4 family)